jgi:predicted phosphodiesterase
VVVHAVAAPWRRGTSDKKASMRIQILSDLHFEFDRDGGEAFAKGVPVAGDVLILGGDLIPLREADHVRRMFSWFCDRFPHVVFVPGNHEYYRTRPVNAEALLTACSQGIPNLHVLNPGVAIIDGIRFVGATLWFPDTPDEVLYRNALNDFRLIAGFVPWVHDTHVRHLAFLRTSVHPGDVVVTHHLPHPRSIAPQHVGSALNRFFVAEDAAGLVERSGARLWVHGHTHSPCDYVIGETRVVCNPRGYPGESSNDFDLGRVVEG